MPAPTGTLLSRQLGRLLAAAVLVAPLAIGTTAQAQRSPAENGDGPVRALAAADLPQSPRVEWAQGLLPQGDSLSEAEIARRIARLYTRQAEILHAEAEGEAEEAARLAEGTMRDLRQLAQRPGITEQQRFQELYRAILTEFERFHGPHPELAPQQGEIYALREAMYAALDNLRDPLLEDVRLPSSMIATFPMTLNRAVENQIRFYLRNNRHVATVRQRAETYFPMIEQILAEEGVPDELKYLAVIESALNPTARSWAGAAGMWQFIPATGRASGLTVTREIDERLDPEKATRAAARHLLELYEMFGDWQLAIAGYNMNPYRLIRIVRSAEARLGRSATYWDVWNSIPRETAGYIPSFIAVSLLFSNPDAFNLPPARQGPGYEFDVVPVRAGTALAELAQRAGTDVRTLQALNPGLRLGRIPAWADGYEVRIPSGHFARHQQRMASVVRSLPGRTPRTVAYHGQNHRVIAFAETNPPNSRFSGPNGGVVPVQQVADGIRSGRTTTATTANPDVHRQSSTATTTDNPDVHRQTSTQQRERVTYTVRRGDTLGHIAQRHGVTVRQLREWNDIRGSVIRVGQRLTIYRAPTRPA